MNIKLKGEKAKKVIAGALIASTLFSNANAAVASTSAGASASAEGYHLWATEITVSWPGASNSYWSINGRYAYPEADLWPSVSASVYCDGAWRGMNDSNYVSSSNFPTLEAYGYSYWNLTTKMGKNCSQLRIKCVSFDQCLENFYLEGATRYYEDIKKDASASAVNKTYNGSSQTGVTGANVTWSGTTSATNAGTYYAYATPASKHAWPDGSTGTKTITWSIARARTASASASNKTYNGSSQTGVTGSNVTWAGTTSATNAGGYTAYATPTSNYAWSNGGTEQRAVSWTMYKKALSGTLTVGVNTSGVASWNGITGAADYTVKVGSSTITTTTSGSYNVSSSLINSAGTKTVSIVANPSSNYTGTVTGSTNVNIYTLTQKDNSGTYTTNHIGGSSTTLRSPASKKGYTFQYWQRTN